MSRNVVVGIDVGGESKGFHAVALCDGSFEISASIDPASIARWCRDKNASTVAVDAPCGWSHEGSSRQAERDMKLGGKKIRTFATPTREVAAAHRKEFWGWVLNGERLYRQLLRHYKLFNGSSQSGLICFETFPHGIACSQAGMVVPVKPKLQRRRKILSDLGYDPAVLPNLDFVDAALCAAAADLFRNGRTIGFGNAREGFIVLPAWHAEP